jgi:hypothetical protein
VHLDPGESTVVALVYPPLRNASNIVWGVYHEFALRIASGGALPQGATNFVATPCTAPSPPAAS